MGSRWAARPWWAAWPVCLVRAAAHTGSRSQGSRRDRDQVAAAAVKSLQSYPTLCDPIDGSPPGPEVPGILQGVGCHFLLQCMKVKSESEVVQSYPTPSNPMDCSLPGPSIHGIFQARVLEWVAIAFSERLG